MVTAGCQREFENAPGIGVTGFEQGREIRGLAGLQWVEIASARADEDFAHTVGFRCDIAVHFGKALVVVVMADQHQIGVRRIERIHQRLGRRDTRRVVAHADQRVMPVRSHAGLGRSGQVGLQPAELIGGNGTARHRIERDKVPLAHIPAVVTLAAITRWAGLLIGTVEIVEVALRLRGVVFMVAGGGVCVALEAAPARFVVLVELCQRAIAVRVVASGEHGIGRG